MKRILLLVLVCFSAAVQADPFNVYLPFKTQYTPGALEKMDMALVVDIETSRKNFQLQVAPRTDSEQFIEVEGSYKPRLALGFSIGLGRGFEFEINSTGGSGMASLKYDFDMAGSDWKHSLVVGKSRALNYGHGGAKLDDDSCGTLDIFCTVFSIFDIFGGSDDKYEFNYEANTEAWSLAYLQGYQYSQRTMPYWGVYYTEYDIDLEVTDNTGGGNDQSVNIKTDLMALVVGAEWKLGKKENNYNKSAVLNYLVYKGSSRHSGELNGELKLSFVVRF